MLTGSCNTDVTRVRIIHGIPFRSYIICLRDSYFFYFFTAFLCKGQWISMHNWFWSNRHLITVTMLFMIFSLAKVGYWLDPMIELWVAGSQRKRASQRRKRMRKRMSMAYHHSVLYMVTDDQYNVFLMGISIFLYSFVTASFLRTCKDVQ